MGAWTEPIDGLVSKPYFPIFCTVCCTRIVPYSYCTVHVLYRSALVLEHSARTVQSFAAAELTHNIRSLAPDTGTSHKSRFINRVSFKSLIYSCSTISSCAVFGEIFFLHFSSVSFYKCLSHPESVLTE